MLVLTRKQGEKIRIGSNIIISVLSAGDNQVKIGIDAPADMKILREEIYETVKTHTVEASKQSKISSEELKKLSLNKLNKKK